MHACTQFDACGYVQKIDFCRSIATKKFIRVGVEIYVYPRQQIYRCRVDIQQLLLYMHIITYCQCGIPNQLTFSAIYRIPLPHWNIAGHPVQPVPRRGVYAVAHPAGPTCALHWSEAAVFFACDVRKLVALPTAICGEVFFNWRCCRKSCACMH